MKITKVRSVIVEVPLEKPIKTAIHNIGSVCAICLTLDTDEDVFGEGYLFAIGPKKIKVLHEMLLSLSEFVVGQDPRYTEKIWSDIWQNINFFGHKGVTIFALSTFDMACWDIKGKSVGLPLYQLIGAYRDEVPVYASGGLWLSANINELQEEAQEFLAHGFTAMKMRVGKPNISEDIERVAAVRNAIGPDIVLMVDANQGFSVQHAIKLGERLKEFDIFWFEEPVAAYNLEGSAQVKEALPSMYLASGETEYTRYGFKQMLDVKAADLLMPDLSRVGGITEFIKVAHLAETLEVPVSPHLFTEQSLQLMGAIPNGIYLEYMPWFSCLFNEKIDFKSGFAKVPQRPGLGFTFNVETLEKYRVDL
jgi:L-alanine-DL-glutamate epimerase-like enolase superfamily enzyme